MSTIMHFQSKKLKSADMILYLQMSHVWPDGDPVLVPVQSVQGPLLIHSQLNVAELSALWHQLSLYIQSLVI